MGIAARRIGDEAEDVTTTAGRPRHRQAPAVGAAWHGTRPSDPSHLSKVGRVVSESRPESFAVRLRSAKRVAARKVDAATIHEACAADDASHSLVGSTWDADKKHVAEVRDGRRPVEPAFGIELAPSFKVCLVFLLLMLFRAERRWPGVVETLFAEFFARREK